MFRQKDLIGFLSKYTIWVTLLIIYLLFIVLSPKMGSLISLKNIIWYAIPLGFLALAEGVALLSGNFDLSVGQGAGLAAMASAIIIREGYSIGIFSIFIPIAIGGILGMINGFFIGFLSLNAFLVTLGTFLIFDGMTLVISATDIYKGFPEGYLIWGSNFFAGLIFLFVILILLSILIYRTSFGVHLRGMGCNEKAARSLGINTAKLKFYTFTLVGLLVGASALLFTGYIGSAAPTMADYAIFPAFAAAVLGGISLAGGRGMLPNVWGGAILLSLIGTGLIVYGFSPFLRTVLFGVVVIIAILIDRIKAKIVAT